MKVQITIRGRTYTVRSDDDDVDLRAVAAYVVRRLVVVAQKATSGFDDYTVAMLACLNIASDFERYRRQIDAELDDLDRELASGEVVLRAALPESTG